ncbi:MAG: BlaI/MecI/CopY family transcriptional regulator [Planctomycetota bacterium]
MARPNSEFPTELELEILKILWESSPLLVRDVRSHLEGNGRALSHSTVITMLNIMHRKGYVQRKKDGKSFLFSPNVEKQKVESGIVGDVISRVFQGSAEALVLNLLETTDLDTDELAEIRKLINRKAREKKK